MTTIQELVKKSCATYVNGECALLGSECPLIGGTEYRGKKIPASDFNCNYFEQYVLPLDKTLEAVYYGKETVPVMTVNKNCKGCGKAFKSVSNRAVYCGDICRESARKKSHRKYNHKRAK
ncbi:hypothetical protein MOE49_00790 [Bacillus inaquosorum]|uniref:hypothetical protein n=1 Tax=Bacillus inaquosorum TaxID=483913 RepID=UPI0022801094|nr:hypothetical protein [Bacillus inaquosorum]MCY9097630.1 hypothetical protein [Bacillus inaquosorum]